MREPDAGTVGGALADGTRRLSAAGSETARLDAEVLLGHVLGVERATLLAHPEARLGEAQAARYADCLERRGRGEPVAYIRGLKEFYGLAFAVDGRVLIPRPETEALVDLALDRIRHDLTSGAVPAGAPPFLVWDVGTGSGAIAIALAHELRRRGSGRAVSYLLSDVSPEALAVAVENAVSHGLADLMTFARGDLLAVHPDPGRPVGLLVANLPYIPTGSLGALPVAAGYEPRLALDGGPDGLALVRRLLSGLASVVVPGGCALLEIGADQAGAAASAAGEALPEWASSIHPDLGGAPRVLCLERPSQGSAEP
jgi:release factor glutamine methyltransferase